MRSLALRRLRQEDDGVAMMTVMMVGAVLMGLALLLSDISLSNLKNAGRDRVAVSAFGAAEAGVQQAVAYLRDQGVDRVDCSPACTDNPWGSSSSPKLLSFGDGRQAKVWVQVLSDLNPPLETTGRYLVHSEGTSGQGPGTRRIEQEVIAEHYIFPMGVYADHIANNGTPRTFQQSVFSENCIFGRDKMVFDGNDIFYGGKAAAFSALYVAEGSGSCSSNNDGNIHLKVTKSGSTTTRTITPCPEKGSPTDRYYNDRDSQGGALGSTACAPRETSYMDLETLRANYGGRVPADVLAALKNKAIAQGNYWTTGTYSAPDHTRYPDAVMYFEVGANVVVTIQNELNAYSVNPETCTPKRSVIIVIDNATAGNGGLNLQSGASLNGGIFIPNGNLDFRGGLTWTGPLNARTINNWAGNAKSQLTQCFLDDLPGGLLDVRLGRFREVDR